MTAYHPRTVTIIGIILSYHHLFQVLKEQFLSVFCYKSNQITCLTCLQLLLHFCTTFCLGPTQIFQHNFEVSCLPFPYLIWFICMPYSNISTNQCFEALIIQVTIKTTLVSKKKKHPLLLLSGVGFHGTHVRNEARNSKAIVSAKMVTVVMLMLQYWLALTRLFKGSPSQNWLKQ